MNRIQLIEILNKHLPDGTEDYAADLLIKHRIHLYIKKPRATKLGDYRPPQTEEDRHRISINNDLNQFSFLITFMHEVAHLLNFEMHKGRVSPHGVEWKRQFQQVSTPVFEKRILPDEVHHALLGYMRNPKASSCSSPQLVRTLRNFDKNPGILVEQVPVGCKFRMKDGREFVMLERRRTRYLCMDSANKRNYLVPGLATCELVL